MKIDTSMIDKDLMTMGRIMKVVNNTFTESRLRLMYKMSRKSRIKIDDNIMHCTEEWIPREDGSRMRICIFRPISSKENVHESMAYSESKGMNQPGVLWLHGGGYALGSPEQSKIYARDKGEVNIAFQMPLYSMLDSLQHNYQNVYNFLFVHWLNFRRNLELNL